ncbi:T-cell-specific guanine nucleotide triphosphate-binding protein 2-like [Alosa pseudoharengus]|uniref:T-cell-specific guanine nucleotide triphosphate-binding protein 2-like n=1 Tax=Alosa pseudoharengus TaxID=34774 RepID=UPI003F88E179
MADVQALLQDSGEPTLEQAIATAKERFHNVVLNIAITGESGVGKSSFVNAIRGLKNNDKAAAPTGITQTTTAPTKYPHETMQNIIFWDLPGIGDSTFTSSTYMKQFNFQNYDFFIIVSASRFKENDLFLANQIKKMNMKFYFVRTKVDLDVNDQEDMGVSEEDALQKIRKDCEKNLKSLKSSINPQVFLLTSRNLKRFDFQKFVEVLETDLPEHKRKALILSVPVYSQQFLQKKYKILKREVWAAAITSGGVGGIPMPGVSTVFDITLASASGEA